VRCPVCQGNDGLEMRYALVVKAPHYMLCAIDNDHDHQQHQHKHNHTGKRTGRPHRVHGSGRQATRQTNLLTPPPPLPAPAPPPCPLFPPRPSHCFAVFPLCSCLIVPFIVSLVLRARMGPYRRLWGDFAALSRRGEGRSAARGLKQVSKQEREGKGRK